jgi:hypothetical protein
MLRPLQSYSGDYTARVCQSTVTDSGKWPRSMSILNIVGGGGRVEQMCRGLAVQECGVDDRQMFISRLTRFIDVKNRIECRVRSCFGLVTAVLGSQYKLESFLSRKWLSTYGQSSGSCQ